MDSLDFASPPVPISLLLLAGPVQDIKCLLWFDVCKFFWYANTSVSMCKRPSNNRLRIRPYRLQ